MAAGSKWRTGLSPLRRGWDRVANSFTNDAGIRRDGNWTWADTLNLGQSLLTAGLTGTMAQPYNAQTGRWFWQGQENPTGPGYGIAHPDTYAGPSESQSTPQLPQFTDWIAESQRYQAPQSYWTRGSGRGSARTAGARTISGGGQGSGAGALEAERANTTMRNLSMQSQDAMNRMFGGKER